MKIPARAGNTAHEYAVPLVIFVLLAGAITYYSDLPEAITRHFGLPPDSRPLKERISIEVRSSLEVPDPDPLNDNPGTPQVIRHPLGSVQLMLNSGDKATLDDYPVNVPELAATEGVSGVTLRYAEALDRLTARLEETGELHGAQARLLSEIANQGRVIAGIEVSVEAWMQGEQPDLPESIGELGFSERAESASFNAIKELSPNRQSRILLNLLDAARENRALDDQAVARFVTEIVARTLFVSEALHNTVSGSADPKGRPKSPLLKEAMIRELQRLNPCEENLAEDERLFCPKT